ncbi:MAG: DUF1929 domain-containing protein [Actinomycetota bacterium]|nr:DUF1929 domain-containing protein [Actinomycetota bacterium]
MRRWGAVLLACPLLVFLTAPPTSARGGTPDNVGLWGEPFEEGPLCPSDQDRGGADLCKPVAKAAAVLPDGRVIYVDGVESQSSSKEGDAPAPHDGSGESRVLDLRSGTPEFVVPPSAREGAEADPDSGFLQCADLVTLADGRVLAVGGNSSSGLATPAGAAVAVPGGGSLDPEGARTARLFDWRTNSWQVAGAMNHGRWYGGAVTLADGRVLVAGGLSRVVNGADPSQLRITETYDPATDTWTENHTGPESESTLPLQPRLFLTPNGKVFYNAAGQMWGPWGQAADEAFYGFQQFFDPETKRWETASRPSLGARSGAFQVPLMLDPPYDQMTILTFGGTVGPAPGSGAAVAISTLTTVDRLGNIANSDTGDLDRARTFASGVLLPDGSVLAIGGSDTDDVLAPGSGVAVHSAEQYNPFKREWIEVADHTRDRDYHSSAVLLPDMRVLLGGHAPAPGEAEADAGEVFSNRDPDPSFEIYSPRYLFRGARPVITHAQAGIAYGEKFKIRTEEPDSIAGVVLLRIASPQHAIDSDQRSLRLEFSRIGSTTLEAVAPPDGIAAPPGYYYLVLIKQNLRGAVPSVARIVHVGETSDYSEAIQPFPDDSSEIAVGQAEPAEDHSDAAALRRVVGETIGDIKYSVPEEPIPASGPNRPLSERDGFLHWPGHRRLAVP